MRHNYLVCRLRYTASFLLCLWTGLASGQSLPKEIHLSTDGRQLLSGGTPAAGFFDLENIHTIQLWFEQTNYWTLLTQNYTSGTDIPASMIIDNDTLPAKVGVRFRGQTSYQQVQNSQKKSFNITLDYADSTQDYKGYETFNLLNGFDDATFMREVLFHQYCRNHIPASKTNFSHLYINGQDWGLYPNSQQLDGDFLKEWFFSNEGTLWRALKVGSSGPGGGTGGPFGTGFCSLNYLNTLDTNEYKKYYTLKRTKKEHPWEDLVQLCNVLGNTPSVDLELAMNDIMDVDRSLWELAYENAFSDDDGYINKGGMDYYLYWEAETGRMTLQEFDANSVMTSNHATWSPFYNANDTRFALTNKLFQVPALRQRYLAHLRSIIRESMQSDDISAIDDMAAMIDPLVQSDPKKIYSYAQFTSGVTGLKTFVDTRRNYLLTNAEVAAADPVFSGETRSVQGVADAQPTPSQTVQVTAAVDATVAVQGINLYYGAGLVGKFTKTAMFDDGNHGDGAAGDGMYGAEIPAFAVDIYVRYYFEAVANTTAKTAAYLPAGAEHDVFLYRVKPEVLPHSTVAINEFMASNSHTVTDQNGEHDDWIELYNTDAAGFDLSGWYLSDNPDNLKKWEFPNGTTLGGGAYLIVWADEDSSQVGLHANFKLSASGETVYLIDPQGAIAQEIAYYQQEVDQSYSRIPNGTGNFVIKAPTFGANNESVTAVANPYGIQFELYPNPAAELVRISLKTSEETVLQVFNALGQNMVNRRFLNETTLNVSAWPAGFYQVQLGGVHMRLVVE
jgi:hypothetical protein